jgi:hypothetical protein
MLKELKEETGHNHPFINILRTPLGISKERMRLADLKIKEYSAIRHRNYR